MRRPTPVKPALLALAALALAGPPAGAGPVRWKYEWTPDQTMALTGPGSGSGVAFSATSPGQRQDSATVSAALLSTFSSAAPFAPDQFGPEDGKYALSVRITDEASSRWGVLTLTGQFQGTISAFTANVHNVFTAPLSQSIDLGTTRYTVALQAYWPPGPPNWPGFGRIDASVTTSPLPTPEPSALLLGCLGVPALGGALWRRARRRRQARPEAAPDGVRAR